MRYSKDHKVQTRAKLVETAARKFQQRGYESVAIGDIMSELQLTHGGFYRHFPDKESLYAEALDASISDVQQRLLRRAGGTGSPDLRVIIESYLSTDHCENLGDGCPVAALSSDVARQSPRVQAAFETALHAYMNEFVSLMPGATDDERKQQFLVLFSGMAGALSAARAVADPALRASILDAARDFYLRTYCE